MPDTASKNPAFVPGFFFGTFSIVPRLDLVLAVRVGALKEERTRTSQFIDIHEDRLMRFHSKPPGDLKMLQSSDPFDEIELD